MTVVVDASVALLWFIEQDKHEEARRLLGAEADLVAPSLLRVEVANVLWKLVRRRELTKEDADEAVHALDRSGLSFTPTSAMLPRALALAVELDHPVYDMVYLSVAEALHCNVVTADRRFHDRVRSGAYADRVRLLGGVPGPG